MRRHRRPTLLPATLPALHPLDRLRWLVEMANTTPEDVLTASPRALAVAVYELRRYIFDSEPTGHPELQKAGAARCLNEALAVVRRLVAGVADHRLEVFDFDKGQAVLDAREEGYLPVVYLDVLLVDRLLHLALEDVRSHFAVARIRRCPEAACERRLYYARRLDQEYCSRACSNRGTARAAYYKNKPKAKPRAAPGKPSSPTQPKPDRRSPR